MRAEAANRLEAAEIRLVWPTDHYAHDGQPVDYQIHKNLGSIVREVVSNTIRHSGATELEVLARTEEGCLHIECRDNGRGLPDAVLQGETGFGLNGIARRARLLSGSVDLDNSSGGLTVRLSFPFRPVSR